VQKGLVPISIAAIERAVELNGVAVEMNKHALAWGRLAAHDHARVASLVHPLHDDAPRPVKGLAPLVERRARFLVRYQNKAYARRYRDFIGEIERAERTRIGPRAALAEAVSQNLFKLMAYKDEYEVARLFAEGDFLKNLRHQFAGDYRLEFNLAPPLFAKRDPETGHLLKRAYGPWMLGAFRILAKFRFLRGTRFDIFGYTVERKRERQLIADYENVMREIAAKLSPANYALAIEIAQLPERIRGFGHVKEAAIQTVKTREAGLLTVFRNPAPESRAAE
jgi:indolepyruvate ferredoxin oxidoreductase